MVVLFVNDSARSIVDPKIFSQPPGNHHLPFYGEHHGASFRCRIHSSESYIIHESKSIGVLLEIIWLRRALRSEVFLFADLDNDRAFVSLRDAGNGDKLICRFIFASSRVFGG